MGRNFFQGFMDETKLQNSSLGICYIPSYTNLLNSRELFKWEYSILANENTWMHQTWMLLRNKQKKNEKEWLLGEQEIVELLLIRIYLKRMTNEIETLKIYLSKLTKTIIGTAPSNRERVLEP